VILRRSKVKSQNLKEVYCKHDNKTSQENTAKKTTAIRLYFDTAESGELRFIRIMTLGISAKDKLKLFTGGFSMGGQHWLWLILD
jgi:hypothetical protein